MSLILNPVVTVGDRMGWDRSLSPLIAAWLRMMAARAELQYVAIVGRAVDDGRPLKGGHISPLLATRDACLRLIRSLDETWGYDRWKEATDWVESIIGASHADPGCTGPPGDAVSDGERESPRS